MRLLDDKKDIKECIQRFESLITSDLSMSDLFEIIDNVVFDYMNYFQGNNSDPNIVSENLFYLKCLRNLFIEKSNQ